jgi:hypothetical protein
MTAPKDKARKMGFICEKGNWNNQKLATNQNNDILC